jgi:hypothetical protein
MPTTKPRTRRPSTETVVVKVPPRVYAAVRRLAEAEYTTPSGYIERRLSEVAAREAEAREQMRLAESPALDQERTESESVNGYL